MFWLSKSITTSDGGKTNVSPIEYIILAHLRRRELIKEQELGQYGKELIDELNKIFSGSWEAQSGTIYPILSKLESVKKLIRGDDKKTELGPVKKVYSLTNTGRSLIDKIVRENYESDLRFIEEYQKLMKVFTDFFSKDTSANICVKCKTQIPLNAVFCPKCGNKLSSDNYTDISNSI
jgi:DNA-binding PadR family transcriptional regulator